MRDTRLLEVLEKALLAYIDTPVIDEGEVLYDGSCGDTDAQFCITKEKDRLFIAFRGTDSTTDLVTDLHFWKQAAPDGNPDARIKVHRGFLNVFYTPCVQMRIRSFVTPDIHKVYTTGHSYGAALAALCALDLQFAFPTLYIQAALFGCPRVGNKAFAEAYNQRVPNTLRVENGNDLVTKIPFALMGYRHVGIRLHIGMPRLPGLFSLREHDVKRYYESLWRA